ncbi:MAG: MauE/DoxX family redox-associated membrane protein [Panacagrimonas sp.]
MNPVLVLLPALFCALLFGVSGLGKLRRQPYYTALIGAWLPLELSAARGLAITLGLVEVGIALALSLEATRQSGAAAAVALLLAYLAGLASALQRGRTDLDCGCGGSVGQQKIHSRLLARNLALALVAAMPLLLPRPSRIAPLELALALVAAVVFYLLYAGLEALPVHRQRLTTAGGRR